MSPFRQRLLSAPLLGNPVAAVQDLDQTGTIALLFI